MNTTSEREPLLLEGKPVVEAIYSDLRVQIAKLAIASIVPCLATILVGDDPASTTYVRMKGNACNRLGMISRRIQLPASTTTSELLQTIHELNTDPAVHGILLQHPVPAQVDERAAFDAIALEKDVDGVTSLGFGKMSYNEPAYLSCTPKAVLSIIDHYGIGVSGRHAVIIGRSAILGKPVAMKLLNRDATVTVCHSKTTNLPGHISVADIVVAAVGKPNFVQGNWLKPGAVIIDAGYNPGNIGDVDFSSAVPRASAITPVPGGVGPVTIATLLQHTVEAANRTMPTA